MGKVPVKQGDEKKSYYRYYTDYEIADVDLKTKEYIHNCKPRKGEGLSVHDREKMQTKQRYPAESGIYRLKEGGVLVASNVPVPGLTPDMLAWWSVWHSLDPLRYAIWDPDDHYDVQISENGRKRALDASVPMNERLWGASHTVTESFGDSEPESVTMHFSSLKDAGYDPALNGTEDCPMIFCANSKKGGKVPIFMTETIHRMEDGDGYEMRLRFWVGYSVENGKAKLGIPKFLRPPSKAFKALMEHNYKEYQHLAKILPTLYEEYKDRLMDDEL